MSIDQKGKRRIISFDTDIIDDVHDQFDGVYSKELIKSILDASINYFKQLQKFTDKLAISIPDVGFLISSAKTLVRRKSILSSFSLAIEIYQQMEMDALNIKIDKLNEIREDGESQKHCFFRDAKSFLKRRFLSHKMEAIQDFQERIFKNNYKL